MYEKFFGFHERPFQLTPNPAYLFLSKSHEDALAHLSYAVSHGDGFVEITGEVGTGKTTLCRVFLNSLGKNADIAYIFNPKLDAVQLLKSINDEFEIDASPDSVKGLIDTLNQFLMEKKREGKQVILLIDEAQNLTIDVLEQIRLLSNLETSTSKLIQIILVGQPELREKLDSHELRQLAQRITLSCHISPLNHDETQRYIHHRIGIAAKRSVVRFNRAAVRAVFRYSRGIPRLINIACDRTLLTAYGLGRRKITGDVARTAVQELVSRGEMRNRGGFGLQKTAVVLACILIAGLLALLLQDDLVRLHPSQWPLFKPVTTTAPADPPAPEPRGTGAGGETAADPLPARDDSPDPPPGRLMASLSPEDEPDTAAAPAAESVPEAQPSPPAVPDPPSEPEPTPEPPREAVQPPPPAPVSTKWIAAPEEWVAWSRPAGVSREASLKTVMALWNQPVGDLPPLPEIGDDWRFFRLTAQQQAFSLARTQGGLDQLRSLNLPAILEITLPGAETPIYMALVGMAGEEITLQAGETRFRCAADTLRAVWSGVAYLPWKNFYGLSGIIPRDTTQDEILTLKMMLREIGFTQIPLTPYYDPDTRNAVRKVQERHGLEVDGFVGPMTKIVLYHDVPSLQVPRIVPSALPGADAGTVSRAMRPLTGGREEKR